MNLSKIITGATLVGVAVIFCGCNGTSSKSVVNPLTAAEQQQFELKSQKALSQSRLLRAKMDRTAVATATKNPKYKPAQIAKDLNSKYQLEQKSLIALFRSSYSTEAQANLSMPDVRTEVSSMVTTTAKNAYGRVESARSIDKYATTLAAEITKMKESTKQSIQHIEKTCYNKMKPKKAALLIKMRNILPSGTLTRYRARLEKEERQKAEVALRVKRQN